MGLLALAGALKIRSRKPAYLSEPFVRATAALDQSIGWDKLPLPLARERGTYSVGLTRLSPEERGHERATIETAGFSLRQSRGACR